MNKPLPQGNPGPRVQRLRQLLYIIMVIGVSILLIAWPHAASARNTPTLDAINYSVMAGDRVRIELRLSVPVQEPKSFVIFDPARIAIDFPGVKLNLPHKSRTINYGLTHSVSAAQTSDRTRVVINLVRLVPYKMDVTDGTIYITIGVSGDTKNYPDEINKSQIEGVVFEPGNTGEGRIRVKLSDPFTMIDTYEQGNNIIVDFFDTRLPEDFKRVLDVTDFATPILSIDTFARDDDTRMVIKTTGNYEHLAYQTHKQQSIDIKSNY